MLREVLDSFVSFTTDMGTEVGTASFFVADIKSLLPSWLRDPWLRSDVDDVEVLWSWPTKPEKGPGRHNRVLACFQKLGGNASSTWWGWWARSFYQALVCGPMPLMPRALIIPGSLHICSNLSKDISAQLVYWPKYVSQLKQVEEVLCDRDRRERFVHQCIGDRPEAAYFKNFSGSLYEEPGLPSNFIL